MTKMTFKHRLPVALFRLFFFAFFLLPCLLKAQGSELNATVRINTPQLQLTERRVFDQMQDALKEFLNNTKWTQDAYEPEERIKCSFIITVSKELGNNVFEGEIAVQAVRPAFGSTYESPLLSHLDKDFTFSYEQNQPIEFLPEGDNQNLAAVLAFYVYIVLALDYDSYALYGGDSHLLMAQQIVNNVQNSTTNRSLGWRQSDGGKNRNRYWIIENLMNPRVKPYRAAMYTFYRKGLDFFASNMEQGKTSILNALEEVDKVNIAYFNSMIVQMFANCKRDELVEMWKVGPRPQRERIVQIMSKVDPANAARYREIVAVF